MVKSKSKKITTFWKGPKPRKHTKAINTKHLTWSQACSRYPKMKAYGDKDKDGVYNMFDYKPFNKNRTTKLIFKPVRLNNKEYVKTINTKHLTWPQARLRYPKMKAFGDADNDGIYNGWDCKPFDNKRHGFEHQYSFSFTDYPATKTVKMKPNDFLKKTWEEGGKRPMYIKPNEDMNKQVSLEEYKRQLQEDRKSIDYIKEKIKSKEKGIAMGFISMREGTPSGHEGRHTAVAAEELGAKEIPVTIETSDEEDIKDYEPVKDKLQAKYSQQKKTEEYELQHLKEELKEDLED